MSWLKRIEKHYIVFMKNGRKCKQSEVDAGSKTGVDKEVNEGGVSEEVGVVKFLEPKACTIKMHLRQ